MSGIVKNTIMAGNQYAREKDYWLKKLSGEIEKCNFPYDVTTSGKQYLGEQQAFRLPAEISAKLIHLSNASDVRLYMILMAGVTALLYKYIGYEDLLLGLPIAKQAIEGEFLNTALVLRNRVSGAMSFKALILEVKQNLFEADEHRAYPLENLVYDLGFGMDNGFPLFDVAVLLQNIHDQKYIEHFHPNILLAFERNGESIEGVLLYNAVLYRQQSIEKLITHLMNLFTGVLENLDQSIAAISILSTEEKEQILREYNNTEAEYPAEKLFHEFFQDLAAQHPDKCAVLFLEQALTYGELNRRANRLARYLQGQGVGPNQIVALMVERSLEMLVGIMAILKAGGAFLPIDPLAAEERRSFMLTDSGAQILLTQARFISGLHFSGEVVNLDDLMSYQGAETDVQKIAEPRDLAYVIYTSGSTGLPKGALIEHRSLVNRLHWMQKCYPLGEHDLILQKTQYTFDVSVWELLWWSMVGAQVVFLKPGEEKNSASIATAIEQYGVTILHFVPSMLSVFLDYIADVEPTRLSTLRHVFASGEALSLAQVERFNQVLHCANRTELHNLYGPTEATIDVTYFDCSKGEKLDVIPIGKPIDNVKLYILDRDQNLLPCGVPGELYISGVGLGRGYLNRPELMAERFLPDPFNVGSRMYRTGDLAQWLPDGNIKYLGRNDFQVKIRGYRIEPGEIEVQLLKIDSVQEAVVTAHTDAQGEKYLCGYFVADRALVYSDLKESLVKSLPEYMVPAYFMQLEQMPLTSNGKIDRKALPLPEEQIASGVEFELPRDGVERALLHIWRELLQIEKIGINDNFFELGGHSLRATTLVSKIHKVFHVECSLGDIFERPTIKELAEHIKQSGLSAHSVIKKVEEREYYPLSSAQKRMFIVSQLEDIHTAYNMPLAFLVKGNLDVARLEGAFKELVLRHESFRTSFEIVEDEAVQKIHQDIVFQLEQLDISTRDEVFQCEQLDISTDGEVLQCEQTHISKQDIDFKREQPYICAEGGPVREITGEIITEEVRQVIREFIRPFDLSKPPLLRVGVGELRSGELETRQYLLLIDMHHIISDGTSMGILVKDFARLYNGETLEELPIQYKDFTVWQNAFFNSQEILEQERFWLDQLSGELPILNLTDYPRKAVQDFHGETFVFTLEKDLVEEVNRLVASTGTTLYMFLLAAYYVLLAKYTNQEDIIIGSPIAGRTHTDLENVVGMFVNTLAMRNRPCAGKTFEQFLHEVKQQSLKAFENQEYQFEFLIEKLGIERDITRNPIFTVEFILENMDIPEIRIDDVSFTPLSSEFKTAKFDLSLYAYEEKGEINCAFEYCTALFKAGTIEKLAEDYVKILRKVVKDPAITLGNIQIIEDSEQDLIATEILKSQKLIEIDLDF